MISLEGVQRRYPTRQGSVTVLRDVNFTIQPGEKVGILGRNGAGKSTMVRLLSGAEKPDAGRVQRSMSVSWPLAFSGGFQGTMTGLDNLRFICRIYGSEWRDHIDYVQDFTELGRFLNEPVKTYSSGMRSRLAFALSMVIDFDCFLIDEIMSVGDHRFHERCHIELFEKRADHAMVIVSHDALYVRSICSRISVLENGYLHNFDDVEQAYAFYYRTPLKLQAPNLYLPASQPTECTRLVELFFGMSHAEEAFFPTNHGESFTEWLLSHPLNHVNAISRYRLNKTLTSEEFAFLRDALDGQPEGDFTGLSLHSALAAVAESRIGCPMANAFLAMFEGSLPIEGPDGLWQQMSLEGGSIRRAATFTHIKTGRSLSLRLDFHRAAEVDPLRNELAEFTILSDGVSCRLPKGISAAYYPRIYSSYPYLLHLFAESGVEGQFDFSLGDEGLSAWAASFCSSTSDFLVPDLLFMLSDGYAVERDLFSHASPWTDRIDQAYWRGTDCGTFRYIETASAPRVVVATCSKRYSDIINAKFTEVAEQPGWEARQKFYNDCGMMSEPEPLSRMIDYRYQIDIDGLVSSNDLIPKLLTGAPVLKLVSELGFKKWYDKKLIPWVNYVPVASDAVDLVEKLEWLRNNPTDAARIGEAGRQVALSLTYPQVVDDARQTITRLVDLNKRLRLR